jgi:AraC-like DNA-binding protein
MEGAGIGKDAIMGIYLKIREGILPRASNGGLFVSPGYGRHGCRTIDSFEIILMRSGQLRMAEADREFTLEANDVLLLFPGFEHKGLSEYDEETSFYWVHFYLPTKKGCQIITERKMKLVIVKGFLNVPQFSHPGRPERLIDLFRQFLHSQEEGFACPLEADLLVTQMLVELAFYAKRSADGPSAQRLTELVKKLIDTRFHRPELGPGMIADELDVNCDYLGRVFKKTAGENIGACIIHRRLREARKLLQESQLNVNQIALKVGFNDPGYFRRLFRRHFDIKPGDLRRLYYRVHVNVR